MHKLSLGVLSLFFASTLRANAADLTPGAWYTLSAPAPVTVEGSVLELQAGSEFMLREVAQDPQSGAWMAHLNMDIDEETGVPSDFWVPYSEITQAGAVFVAYEYALTDDGFVLFKRKGMTYCYRDVKNAAIRLGVCKRYASGSEAWMGYKIMQRECGLHPVSYSASNKIGTICFSSGSRMCGGHKCGHVAIKTGKNRWFGAGTRATPWVGTAKGCIAK